MSSYVIAPPSWNIAGPYRWILSADGALRDVTELPPALLERLLKLQAPPPRRSTGRYRFEPRGSLARRFASKLGGFGAISEGQRNVSLASLGGWLRNEGASCDEIEDALLTLNAHVSPPMSEREVCRIAASVSRYAPRMGA